MRRLLIATLAWVVLSVLFGLAVMLSAHAQDEEPVGARVLCDRGQVAVLQIAIPEPGVYTLRIPRDVCGRSA
jgi:hypothetical protein